MVGESSLKGVFSKAYVGLIRPIVQGPRRPFKVVGLKNPANTNKRQTKDLCFAIYLAFALSCLNLNKYRYNMYTIQYSHYVNKPTHTLIATL